MRKLLGVFGVLAALLGGLWLLQGLGIANLKPILCVGACTPLAGPSATWAIIGAVVLAAGIAAAVYGFRRR